MKTVIFLLGFWATNLFADVFPADALRKYRYELARCEEMYKGALGQVVSLYLFNNAVYAHLEQPITKTHYWAIYYP
jgi:hypothetical protein